MPAGDDDADRRLKWSIKAKKKAKYIQEFKDKRDEDLLNLKYHHAKLLAKGKTPTQQQNPNDANQVATQKQSQPNDANDAYEVTKKAGVADAKDDNDATRGDKKAKHLSNESDAPTEPNKNNQVDSDDSYPQKPTPPTIPQTLAYAFQVMTQQIENNQQALGAIPGLAPLMPPSPLDGASSGEQVDQANNPEIVSNSRNQQNPLNKKSKVLTQSQLKTKAQWNTHKRHQQKEKLTKLCVLLGSLYLIMLCVCGMAIISWYSMYREEAKEKEGQKEGRSEQTQDLEYHAQSRPIYHAILF